MKRHLFGILMVLLLAGCDASRVYEQNYAVPDGVWSVGEKVQFIVPAIDSLQFYNLYINLRNTPDYPYSNLYLFLETRYPDNRISRDTLQCILADERGQWKGKGLGDLLDNRIMFRRKFRFPVSGEYQFFMEQAMRDDDLEEIKDVGLRIEKAN